MFDLSFIFKTTGKHQQNLLESVSYKLEQILGLCQKYIMATTSSG